jgi:hypothetical protein
VGIGCRIVRLGRGAAAIAAIALTGLVACQPDFSGRIRGFHARFDDGRGTVVSASGSETPSGQHSLSVTVDRQYCDASNDELVRRSLSAQSYNASGPDVTVEVRVSAGLEEGSARLGTLASVSTKRWDGCDADPDGEPVSEQRTSVELRARLTLTGTGPVRSDRPGEHARDAVAEGTVRVVAPAGRRIHLRPSDDAVLFASDGMEE